MRPDAIMTTRRAAPACSSASRTLIPAFHDELVAPASYVPPNTRWLIVDPEACRRVVDDAWADAAARYAERKGGKMLTYPPAAHFVTADEIGAR